MLKSSIEECITPFETFPESLTATKTRDIIVLIATTILLNLTWFLANQINHKM